MKKIFYLFYCLMAVFAFSACSDDDDDSTNGGNGSECSVNIQLAYPSEANILEKDSVEIIFKNMANGMTFKHKTDSLGCAAFIVPAGSYEAFASDARVRNGVYNVFEGHLKDIVISDAKQTIELPMMEAKDKPSLKLQVTYPEELGIKLVDSISVSLKNLNNGITFNKKSDMNGMVEFSVPSGLYEASASDSRLINNRMYYFNARVEIEFVDADKTVALPFESSVTSAIVIKELYFGGCPKDDGSGKFSFDQYFILYNNADVEMDLSNYAIAMVNPFNSQGGKNKDYVNGVLSYAKDKKVPAGVATWFFTSPVKLAPGKQIVVSMNGAVDHSATYSQSVNLANPDYYCFYDLANFSKDTYYPAPFEGISESHYMKCYKWGLGTAWPLSMMSPAFFVFEPQGTTLKAFIDDKSNINNYGGNEKQGRYMVPESWVIDGIEVFKEGETNNQKRLTNGVDAGFINFTNALGYSIYRNVDKAATEAIAENNGKLVMGSDDPSGIDAEASIKNGARIIYMDTNNSTNDVHVRKTQSLRK